jgi:exopolysaccharide biosynthesis protein
MMNYRTVTIAVVGLFLSVSFLASSGMAAEKDGVIMKDGKIWRMQDGKEIGRMDRETTLSNGTKVMMNGKMMLKDGKETQLQEGQIMMLDGKMMEGGKGK